MTKKEFNEAMKFANNSRPDAAVGDKLASRETPFKKVDFPEPDDEGYSNYEELLATDEYDTALQRLAEYTGNANIGSGIQGGYYQLSIQASRILSEIQNAERTHEVELEELCERMIREYFKIPENRLQFDIKLETQSMQVNQDPTEAEVQEQEEELVDEILNLERAKRRLLNAMTQGHAVDGTWMFKNVIPEIQRITGVENLTDKYAIFVSTMMLGYCQFQLESSHGVQRAQ